jgi:hypothetical protein
MARSIVEPNHVRRVSSYVCWRRNGRKLGETAEELNNLQQEIGQPKVSGSVISIRRDETEENELDYSSTTLRVLREAATK